MALIILGADTPTSTTTPPDGGVWITDRRLFLHAQEFIGFRHGARRRCWFNRGRRHRPPRSDNIINLMKGKKADFGLNAQTAG